jgi:IS1 family transposase
VKYHRGNPNKGLKVWIVGLVDRGTNSVILYPVSDRSEATLLPIIQRHVRPGVTIYNDGWSAYFNLNDAGYRHFTVLHKYALRKEYHNIATEANVSVHTNRIVGHGSMLRITSRG